MLVIILWVRLKKVIEWYCVYNIIFWKVDIGVVVFWLKVEEVGE